MKKQIITGGMLLTILASLWSGPTRSLDLDWMTGCWHSGDDPAIRLLWSRPDPHGISGMLLDGRQTTLLSLDSSGHLVTRAFDSGLQHASPLQDFTLLEQQLEQLRFNHDTSLTHLSGRSQANELKLELQGKTWTFQLD